MHKRLVLLLPLYDEVQLWCYFPLGLCAWPRVIAARVGIFPADLRCVMSPVAPLALQLAERLKLSDPLLLEMPEQDQMLEPDWLLQLRACCREWEVRRSGDAVGQLVCVVVCLQEHPPPLP